MSIKRAYDFSCIATPPGEIIQEMMDDRNISYHEMAEKLAISKKDFLNLLEGDIELTPDIADKLEKELGMTKTFWLKFEDGYQNDFHKIKQLNAVLELEPA